MLRLLRRVLVYGAVGIGVALCYSVLVAVMLRAQLVSTPTLAAVFAFLLVLPLSYVAQRRTSFGDRPRDGGQPARFAVLALTTFGISVGGMAIVVELLGLPYWGGLIVTWVCVPIAGFLMNTLWVFPASKPGGLHSSS